MLQKVVLASPGYLVSRQKVIAHDLLQFSDPGAVSSPISLSVMSEASSGSKQKECAMPQTKMKKCITCEANIVESAESCVYCKHDQETDDDIDFISSLSRSL